MTSKSDPPSKSDDKTEDKTEDKKATKPAARRGPRGTKEQVAAVQKTAQEAARDLDREQTESVIDLATALGQIGEGEALAQLDTRLAFMERQVERLNSRREEADRGIQGELTVMRTRIEEALSAVGATTEEQRNAWGSLENQVSSIVADAERHTSDAIETLRRELVTRVEDAATRLERAESKLRGETKALEDGVEERIRTLSSSMAETQEDLSSSSLSITDRFAELETDLSSKVETSTAGIDERISSAVDQVRAEVQGLSGRVAEQLEGFETEFTSSRARLTEDLSTRTAALEAQLAEKTQALVDRVESDLNQLKAEVSTGAEGLDARIEAAASSAVGEIRMELERLKGEMTETIQSQRSDVLQIVEDQRVDNEGRMSEARAAVRLEAQRMKETVDSKLASVDEGMALLRKELLAQVQSVDERVANGTTKLEALVTHQSRRLATDENEWSETTSEIVEDISALKNRIEELFGRVSSSEARRATERGSAQASIDGMGARLDALERRMRQAVEEVSARQATRLEMLTSQVEHLHTSSSGAEERAGAVEYLTRKIGEITERSEEALTKVNALGRYITKRPEAVKGEAVILPPDMDARLAALEKSITKLGASREEPAAIPDELTDRLAALEAAVGSMAPPEQAEDSQAADLAARIETLERTITNLSTTISTRQAQLTGRLEEVERKAAPVSQTILPGKKRGRW